MTRDAALALTLVAATALAATAPADLNAATIASANPVLSPWTGTYGGVPPF
jgi:hypothetical protein